MPTTSPKLVAGKVYGQLLLILWPEKVFGLPLSLIRKHFGPVFSGFHPIQSATHLSASPIDPLIPEYFRNTKNLRKNVECRTSPDDLLQPNWSLNSVAGTQESTISRGGKEKTRHLGGLQVKSFISVSDIQRGTRR